MRMRMLQWMRKVCPRCGTSYGLHETWTCGRVGGGCRETDLADVNTDTDWGNAARISISAAIAELEGDR